MRLEKDRYVFSTGPGQEIHLTRDLAIAKSVRAHQVVAFDPPVTIGWPLQVGKWGTSTGVWRTPDFATGLLARLTWSVDAYEEVRVPAGTFKAFRLSLSAGPVASDLEARWPSRTGKLWYAPDARRFIKAEGRFEIALNDFQVVIFFAGHGAPEIDPRGVESDGLAKYLVPADVDLDDLYSTGLPMDELATIFSRIESDQVVVFLDACYSGAAGVKEFLNQAAQERFWEERSAERFALKLRVTVGVLGAALPEVKKALDTWIAWVR